MLLGQLYVQDKLLNSIEYPITPKSLQSIDILGLDRRAIGDVPHEESKSLTTKIKNQFISNYLEILKENNYNFAVKFWSGLTCFEKTKKIQLKPKTDFQASLINFNKLDKNSIKELIKEAEINHTEEDFALLYGIKTLFKLSEIIDNDDTAQIPKKNNIDKNENNSNLNHHPEIVIVSDSEFEPLFININCIFVDSGDSLSGIKSKVDQVLSQTPTVKLVLVKKKGNLVSYLQKNLNNLNSVLITSLELGSVDSNGYFDKIVKDTLGIRLV